MQRRSARVLNDGRGEVDGELIAVEGVRLEGVLGRGANGVVFSATQVLLNRPVAVKVWPPRRDKRRSQSQRTGHALQEAVKLASLNDDSIVRVFTAGILPNEWAYVVMERIEGVPLKDIAADELKRDLSGRMMIWRTVAFALSAAERVGIFHGDLHFGNVIVQPFSAKVIDFGTSALAGKDYSLNRHRRLVYNFARALLPELRDYIEIPNLPKLVEPRYALEAAAHWVSAANDLRELEPRLAELSDDGLVQHAIRLGRHSTTLVDLDTPIVDWLEKNNFPQGAIARYRGAAAVELQSRWAARRRREELEAAGQSVLIRLV